LQAVSRQCVYIRITNSAIQNRKGKIVKMVLRRRKGEANQRLNDWGQKHEGGDSSEVDGDCPGSKLGSSG